MVTIKQVTNKHELKTFVDFPNRLYKDCPQFIPSMFGDDMDDWNPKKNPAFEYCDARCYLALRDGQVVGRIGAILNHRANEKWGTRRMRFTQVDFIDDTDVSEALFRTVENYARECGCTEVHGPLGFCDLDREGMLAEGFDERSLFITYYNHPYYIDHLTRLGYVKDVDWTEQLIEIPQDQATADMLSRAARFAMKRMKLHVADVRHQREYGKYVEQVFRLVNVSYAKLYSTVELSDRQIRRYAKKFIPLINPLLTCFVMDSNDEMVAFGVAAPSMESALKNSRGRIFPTGWIGILHSLHKNDSIDMFLIAVHPDLWGTGVNAIILDHVLRGCHKMGITTAETGPMLETNMNIQLQWKFLKARQHKRRRCFIKLLG
ncbi:MAG: hypothetical protein PUJ09_03545 [Eubacteriales bacterium]|nr:hypothetical protein [Eubacteriales bacterium]